MTYLVVTDWDQIGWDKLDRVLDKMGDAVKGVEDMPDVLTAKGEPRATKRIEFDANMVRDTHAHGWATGSGYVAHVDDTGTWKPAKATGHWYTR